MGARLTATNKMLVKKHPALPILQSICQPRGDATAWASVGIPPCVDMNCVTVTPQEIINITIFSYTSIITRSVSICHDLLRKNITWAVFFLILSFSVFLILHQSTLKRCSELANFLVYWNKQLCFLHIQRTIFCFFTEAQK